MNDATNIIQIIQPLACTSINPQRESTDASGTKDAFMNRPQQMSLTTVEEDDDEDTSDELTKLQAKLRAADNEKKRVGKEMTRLLAQKEIEVKLVKEQGQAAIQEVIQVCQENSEAQRQKNDKDVIEIAAKKRKKKKKKDEQDLVLPEIEEYPPTEYDLQRLERIAVNNQRLKDLGLLKEPAPKKQKVVKKRTQLQPTTDTSRSTRRNPFMEVSEAT
jgi:hypothetical protein